MIATILKFAIGITALFAMTAVFQWAMPGWVLSMDMFPAFIVANLVIVAAWFLCRDDQGPVRRQRRLLFLLWWVLISSEEFFVRLADTDQTARGDFAVEAFEEAMIWVLVFLLGAVLASRNPSSLSGLWRKPWRWLTAYGLVCLASCAWSEQKSFSIAWAFKLCVVIILLQMIRNEIQDERGLRTFLTVTLLGLAFVSIWPPLRAPFMPGPVFEDGRLGNTISPTGLSGIAGTLLLVALAAKPVIARWWVTPLAIVGAGIMFLAGGKTAIVATVFSAVILFALQKRLAAAAGVFAGVLALGVVIISLTPVSGYLMSYAASGDAATVSARSTLWDLSFPLILNHPLRGYGYATSRFISMQVEDVTWNPGHMHNGFLEALYNNGAIGLLLMVLIHAAVLLPFLRALRDRSAGVLERRLAAGCAAIYLNLLINGMFNATFGGRVGGMFVALLALLVIGEKLPVLRMQRIAETPAVEMVTVHATPQLA